MSIIVNSTGRAKKGQVTVRLDSGSVKACFPRPCFPNEKNQVKKATGIPMIDGWEAKADQLQRRLQLEMEEGKLNDGGCFNEIRYREILEEYRLKPSLKLIKGGLDDQPPPKPELSLLEVWDMYTKNG